MSSDNNSNNNDTNSSNSNWWHHVVAGAAAGAAQSIILQPLDVIKTRLQGNCNYNDHEKNKDNYTFMMTIFTYMLIHRISVSYALITMYHIVYLQ